MVCSAILEIAGDLGCVRVTTSQENPKCQGVWVSESSDCLPRANRAPRVPRRDVLAAEGVGKAFTGR